MIIAVEPEGREGSTERELGGGTGEGESSSQVRPRLQNGSHSLPGCTDCLAAAWPVPARLRSCLHPPPTGSTTPCAELLRPHCGTQAWEGDAAGQDGEHHGGAHPNEVSVYEINASMCLDECREAFTHPRRCFSEACWHSLSVQTHLLRSNPASPARQQQPPPPPEDESYLPSVCWHCHRGRRTQWFGAGQAAQGSACTRTGRC